MANNSSNTLDFNNKWNYPLQWMQESTFFRLQYQALIYRVNKAMIGEPWENIYQKDVRSNLDNLSDEDRERLGEKCLKVPEGRSYTLSDAVKTIANQMASGVDTYEYTIDDPYMVIDKDLEARLATQCSIDYAQNKLESYASVFSSDIMKYGLAAAIVKYDPKSGKNIVERVNPKNTWVDSMYNSTGRERYRGYSTMISWHALKKMIEQDKDEINTTIEAPTEKIFDDKKKPIQRAKLGHKKIKTLNDLDIYVENINELANSPDLRSLPNLYADYSHDFVSCYNVSCYGNGCQGQTVAGAYGTEFYRSYATDPKARTKNGYNGMDVELTVIYDLAKKIEFKIINRRYVISMNKTAFRRGLFFPITNPLTDQQIFRYRDVELECPLQFGFFEANEMDARPYPTTPLFDMLDVHDQLCGWVARRQHVSKILSILRIETNGADASSLKGLFNIMGIVIDDIQGEINSINFNYSYDPIDSEIARLTEIIQSHLSAFTQFDAMQAMGDRASAAESGMAIGAIAQGLSVLQNSLMQLYADIARQCLMNRVVYSPVSEFPIVNAGNYSVITIQEMALHAIIRVKPKMAKKVMEKQLAANAMAVLSSGLGERFSPTLQATLIEQALFGQLPSKMVEENLLPPQPNPQEVAAAQQQAANEAQMLQQNAQLYEANPTPYEAQNIVDNFSPEEVGQIISGISESPRGIDEFMEVSEAGSPEALDMVQQDGAMSIANLAGNTSELGSQLANPNSMI